MQNDRQFQFSIWPCNSELETIERQRTGRLHQGRSVCGYNGWSCQSSGSLKPRVWSMDNKERTISGKQVSGIQKFWILTLWLPAQVAEGLGGTFSITTGSPVHEIHLARICKYSQAKFHKILQVYAALEKKIKLALLHLPTSFGWTALVLLLPTKERFVLMCSVSTSVKKSGLEKFEISVRFCQKYFFFLVKLGGQ